MNRYHRDLITGVRALGATEVGFIPGGKHSKLQFVHAGKLYKIPAASSPGDFRALTNSLRSIRRQLQEETMLETKTVQEPEQLPLPEIPEKPNNQCTIANYSSNGTMTFRFPPALYSQLSIRDKYDITRVSADIWEIKPGTQSVFGFDHISSKGRALRISRSANIIARDLTPFNSRPAQYQVIDGHILIELLGELPIKPPVKPVESVTAPHAPHTVPWLPNFITTTLIARLGSSPTDDDLRGLLAALRHIETTTQLRLKRDGDKLVFIARIE